MNIKELAQAIGKTAYLRTESFQVKVTISDVKQAYGNTRYEVTPVSGSGVAWVDETRLSGIGAI